MEHLRPRYRRLGILLFFLYLAGLSYFLFFAESLGREESGDYRYNLELFKEIRRFWTYRELLGWRAFFLNTAGNVLAFLPFGFFLPVVLRRRMNLLQAIVTGGLFSLLIETIQFVTTYGSFDVDDILLNTAGAALGYLLLRLLYFLWRRRRHVQL